MPADHSFFIKQASSQHVDFSKKGAIKRFEAFKIHSNAKKREWATSADVKFLVADTSLNLRNGDAFASATGKYPKNFFTANDIEKNSFDTVTKMELHEYDISYSCTLKKDEKERINK